MSDDKVLDVMIRVWSREISADEGLEEIRALLAQPSDGALTSDGACNTCGGQGEVFVSKGAVSYGMLTEPDPVYARCPNCSAANELDLDTVSWTFDKPTMQGAYWIRGNGLEVPALVEVKTDTEFGLLCNLHQRNSEADFVYGYAVADLDLDCEFEWLGPLALPKTLVLPEELELEQERTQPNSWDDHAMGWNACLDQIKELNP